MIKFSKKRVRDRNGKPVVRMDERGRTCNG